MPFNAPERWRKDQERIAKAKAERIAAREAAKQAKILEAKANEPPKVDGRLLHKPGRTYNTGHGTAFHKPGCKCTACKARNWSAEAIPRPTGAEGDPPTGDQPPNGPRNVIQVDMPQMVAPKQKGEMSVRDRIGQWMTIRYSSPNLTTPEIAEKMGISYPHLAAMLRKAAKDGWLRFDDPMERIENEIIPKTLDNLNEFLDQKDRTVTIETAKGTLFKQFQESKGLQDNKPMVLALKIETAAPTEQVMVIEGNIVGRPKQLAGE